MVIAFVDDRCTECRAAERGHQVTAQLLITYTPGNATSDRPAGAAERTTTVFGRTGDNRATDHRTADGGLVRYLTFLLESGTSQPIERFAVDDLADVAEVLQAARLIPRGAGSGRR